MSLAIAAYRQAGDQIEDVDIDDNANIESKKLGTRTLYLSIPAPAFQKSGTGVALTSNGVFGGVTLPDANTGNMYVSVPLPDEWLSGNITLRVFWKTAATAGNMKLSVSIKSAAANGTTSLEETVTATVAALGTTNRINQSTFAFAAADFTDGDVIGILISRDPADVADTISSDVMVIEATLEYTGQG